MNSIRNVPMVLSWMKEHGSSVLLNWGEDDDLWECSWITGGDRFVGHSKTIEGAICAAVLQVNISTLFDYGLVDDILKGLG